MKVALVTTTVNVPRVLQLYRAHDPDVMFFVAGDLKTPPEAKEFCASLSNCVYLDSYHFGWKHSPIGGFNNDSRRNIAFLAAIGGGAEANISGDYDNPRNNDPVAMWQSLFDT